MTHAEAVVYLVRHGRTGLNAEGVLRGRLDPHLDAVGHREAQALADAFSQFDVGAILSSPLLRARETSAAVAASAGVEVALDDRLSDRDYGPWAGAPPSEVCRRFGSVDAAPGVEPRDALAHRALAAVSSSIRPRGLGDLVVVAHDAVLRCLLEQLVPSLDDIDTMPQPTGSWHRLERHLGRWSAAAISALPSPGDSR
jgi:broad specificity phosphatase PhoE